MRVVSVCPGVATLPAGLAGAGHAVVALVEPRAWAKAHLAAAFPAAQLVREPMEQ